MAKAVVIGQNATAGQKILEKILSDGFGATSDVV
jgi:hypothetical protein